MRGLVAVGCGAFALTTLCTIFAGCGDMQDWQPPKFEEIDMNAEIGGYEPDSPDERGDEPAFLDMQAPEAARS